MKRAPRRSSSSSTGSCASCAEARGLVGRQPGHRRDRAHAAGVRAAVAVADALVVLRGQRAARRDAVAQREQRDLLADEQLLDHHAWRPASPCASPEQERARRGDRLVAAASQTTTPLPAARPSALTTQAPPGMRRARRSTSASRRAARVPRGRHAGGLHHVLGERLRALQPRGLGARPEHRQPGVAHVVGEPGHERRLGADHDELAAQLDRELRRAPRCRATATGWHVASSAMPGLPGRAVQLAARAGCGRAPRRARARGRRSRPAAPSRASYRPAPKRRPPSRRVYRATRPTALSAPRQREDLIASLADADERDRHADLALDQLEVLARASGGRSSALRMPSIGRCQPGSHLEHRARVVEVGLVGGEVAA